MPSFSSEIPQGGVTQQLSKSLSGYENSRTPCSGPRISKCQGDSRIPRELGAGTGSDGDSPVSSVTLGPLALSGCSSKPRQAQPTLVTAWRPAHGILSAFSNPGHAFLPMPLTQISREAHHPSGLPFLSLCCPPCTVSRAEVGGSDSGGGWAP